MPITFLIFIFLVWAEYFGLGAFIPLYKKLPIPLLLAFGLFVYVISKNKFKPVMEYKIAKYYMLFMFMTFSAMLYGVIQSYAIDPFKMQLGYFMLLVIAFYIIENKKNIMVYAWMYTITHVSLVFLNLNKMGGQREGAFKGSYFIGDGNDFAWSLNTALPIAFFLLFSSNKMIVRYGVIFIIGIILLGIIGTQSRGAALALTAGFIYYFLFVTKRKMSALVVVLLVASVVTVLAPANYFTRMETISSYEEDTSAMGRIKAWRTATEMAVDNPVLGVGAGSFNSAYGRSYRKPNDPVRWISTHSVYFKVLAEYGFLGMFFYLMIIISCFKTNNRTRDIIERNPDKYEISALWPKCLNWSLTSWSVCAMFLTGLDYPHLFLLAGLTMSINRIVTNSNNDPSAVTEKSKKLTPWEQDHGGFSADVFK